jgi:hypothetical protein
VDERACRAGLARWLGNLSRRLASGGVHVANVSTSGPGQFEKFGSVGLTSAYASASDIQPVTSVIGSEADAPDLPALLNIVRSSPRTDGIPSAVAIWSRGVGERENTAPIQADLP